MKLGGGARLVNLARQSQQDVVKKLGTVPTLPYIVSARCLSSRQVVVQSSSLVADHVFGTDLLLPE